VYYFTGIDVSNFFCVLLLIFEILMYAVHKLIFKRADYVVSVSLDQTKDFKRLSLLFTITFFFDSLVVNSLLSYDSLIQTFRESNTELYI